MPVGMLLIKPILRVQALVHCVMFITVLLLAILLSSCVTPGLRHLPLVSSPANTTDIRVGYLGLCIESNCTVTSLGNVNITGLQTGVSDSVAVEFRDHSVRPYFVILALFGLVFSYFVMFMSVCARGKMNLNPIILAFLTFSWGFCVIAAVWQEVAVHSAVVFLGAVRGAQASGMIWASVALLTVAAVGQACKRRTQDPTATLDEKA